MLIWWWAVFALFLKRAHADSNCFCSVTGDPHIRDFDGLTSTVGAGEFMLVQDYANRFNVEIIVAQTAPAVTQIMEVKVNLVGDVVETLPGYGHVHKADGIEIRVFENNNVLIIWDSNKGDTIKPESLCGTQCGRGTCRS